MLRLHKTWKTKNWATRMQLEVLGMAVVDAHLTCRMLMPKWRDRDDSESNFQAFVDVVVLQVDGRTEEQLDLEEQLAQAASPATTQARAECALVSGPRAGVRSSGAACAKMQRCFYCKKEKRHNKEGRSHPTSCHCRAHPEYHACNVKTRPCTQEHLDHMACDAQRGGSAVPNLGCLCLFIESACEYKLLFNLHNKHVLYTNPI
jgi:hypothetical protein